MSVTSSRKILVRVSAEAGLESVRAAPGAAEWVAAAPRPVRGEHPWDEAHRVVRDPGAAGLESLTTEAYAEPDLVQRFPYERFADVGLESLAAPHPCADVGHDEFWPVGTPEFGWHLDDNHSGLKSTREFVGNPPGR